MRNIGRPFTLYSDFLPSGKESRKWQYLAFGYFDGVNVGDNLFEDGEWNLEKMWQHSEKEKDIFTIYIYFIKRRQNFSEGVLILK